MIAANPTARTDPVPRRTKLALGVGGAGGATLIAVQSFFLLFFYTDVVLIPVGTVTAALLVAKIWDIVNDPLFGWLSDRTTSRWGRRRVYLVYGAVPLAIVTYMLFSIPVGLSGITAFLVVVVTFAIFDTVFTMTSVPMAALTAELSYDYDERTSIVSYSSAGAIIGFLVGGAATPLISGAAATDAAGYRLVGLVFGILSGLAVALVAWKVQEPNRPEAQPVSLPVLEAVRTTFANGPFVKLIAAIGLVRFGFTTVSTALAFFVVHQLLEDETKVAPILATMLVVSGISIPFWRRVADKKSKATAYAVGLVITAVTMTTLFFVPAGGTGAVLPIVAVVGFGISAQWILPFAMIPDVVEYDQLVTGERREGMYYGVFGLADKIARTLGLVAVGAVLAVFGYEPDVTQTESALLGIRLMTGPVPALFLLAAVPILLRYPVDRSAHNAVREELSRRS